MPSYIFPRNDNERLARAKQALNAAEGDLSRGNNYITQETFTTLSNAVPPFEEALKLVLSTLSGREKEVRESNAAFLIYERYIRDFWEMLKRRVKRNNEPAEVLTFYGLTLDGTIPKPSTHHEWFVIGEKIMDGEQEAVLKGYPATVSPSADEVNAKLSVAKAEAANVSSADRSYDEAQAGLASLRVGMDALLSDIMAQLRFNLRNLEPSSQRRIMRTYGAKFSYLEDEPIDEGDENSIMEGDVSNVVEP